MSRSLSIGVVCFPSLGGSGVIASELALGLGARGHQVHLIATARPGRAAAPAPGVSFHAVAVPDYPIFERAPYTLALASRIADVARLAKLDLIHVHYAVPHAVSAYLARQLLGAGAPRLVTSLHGTDVITTGADPSYREVTCLAVASSDGVTVPSASLREQAHTRLGLRGVPIEVMPNFVDAERFTPAERRDRGRLHALFPRGEAVGPILFHVSTFRPVKRIGDLLEVLALVRRELPARLVAIGDGPERAAAERRAAELGLEDHVVFLGQRAVLGDLLCHADAFLLPSQTESFGVAALEALSCGVPVFGYRVGGLPEVVDETVGRLAPPFDVAALAHALTEVLASPAVHDELARAARRRVIARFRREPAIDGYEAYFRRILESPTR